MKALFLALNASFTHTSLSARYIRSACRAQGMELLLVEGNINERAEKLSHLVAAELPDVLLCSVYIWNMRLMADICTRLKLMFPSLVIVWGGPEVSYSPTEVLAQHPYVDALGLGEGEVIVPVLLAAIASGSSLHGVAGVATRMNTAQTRPQVANLDLLPDPYGFTEEFTPNKLYYFESSRGCPYACAYCLSSAETGVRFMSLPEAKRRISGLAANAHLVKFVDRTFNADPARARDLWEYLLALPGECRFHFEICAHLLREADFAILSRPEAKRFQFEIGLQSTFEPALSAINRAMDVDKLLANVKRLVSLRTAEVHLDLIAALPNEKLERFLATLNQAMSVLPERLHLGFLKLLPGTVLRREARQHGYAFLPYPPYEVLRGNHLTAADLLVLKQLEQNINRYYNSKLARTSLSYALSVIAPSELFGSLPSEVPSGQLQESLWEHLREKVPDAGLLQELLRFDFCLNEPHRKVPVALQYGMGNEDSRLRDFLYGEPAPVYALLPHRAGEKAGQILRTTRLAYFRPGTLAYLGLGGGELCLFDYTQPPAGRAFALNHTAPLF